jgi:hypothetical protein
MRPEASAKKRRSSKRSFCTSRSRSRRVAAAEAGLHVAGEVADLVDEEDTAAGGGEEAGVVTEAEEAVADVARRERAGLERDEGAVLAAARGVELLRDERLARAGLALDEDRLLARREAREDGVELPHRGALAEDLAERRRLRELDEAGRLALDGEDRVADADGLAADEDRLADEHAVDGRAVRRPEVAQLDVVTHHADRRVTARDLRVRQAEDAHRALPEQRTRRPARIEREHLTGIRSRHHGQDEGGGAFLRLRPRERLAADGRGLGGAGGRGTGAGVHLLILHFLSRR